MHCDDAIRALYAAETPPDLEMHLSACDECRFLAEDLAQMNDAFARARAEWVPSPGFHVALPAAPWRKLAIAASLLLIPLAAWAASALRPSEPGGYDVVSILDHRPSAPLSDRQLLGSMFLEDSQP